MHISNEKIPFWVIIFLILFGFITFFNSFDNEFLMDDFPMLVGNLTIGAPDFLQLDPSAKSQVYFRPVTHFLNLITFSLFGTNPSGYHLINLIILITAAFVIYKLIETVFSNGRVAFWTAVLFMVHPINSVCVNYKNATADAFLVLSLTMALLHSFNGFKNKDFSDHFLSFIWLTLAVLCHEIAIAFPLYLGALLLISKRYAFYQVLRMSTASASFLILYLVFRLNFASLGGVLTKPAGIDDFSQIVFWYLNKLFTMNDIVLIWNLPSGSIGGEIWTYSLIILIVGLLGAFVFMCQRNPQAALGLLWFMIGFLPVVFACSSRPWFGVIVEPFWLIMASIGFFLFFVGLIDQIFLKKSIITTAILAIFASLMITKAWQYNDLWGNPIRYSQYWLNISPQNFFPRFWLAYSLMQEKNYARAKAELTTLINQGLAYEWTYGNLGIAQYHLKNYENAKAAFKTALKFNPRRGDTHYYLGLIYAATGDFLQARKAFGAAIRYSPELVDAKKQLENLIIREQRRDR